MTAGVSYFGSQGVRLKPMILVADRWWDAPQLLKPDSRHHQNSLGDRPCQDSDRSSSSAGQEAAVEKLKGFLDQVAERYPKEISHIEGTWDANVLNYEFTTFGIKVDGTLTVEEQLVRIGRQFAVCCDDV